MRWLLITALALLAGCDRVDSTARSRAIPTDAPKPPFIVWVPVTGKSMLPKYPEAHWVEVDVNYPYRQLKVGDEVMLWDYTRAGTVAYTFHPIVGTQGDYFITQGLNKKTNPVPDRPWLTPDNYQGKGTGRSSLMLLPPVESKP